MTVTPDQFLAAFKATWNGVARASGNTPDIVVVQNEEAAGNVRNCLDILGLDAHVIIDEESHSPKRLLITTEANLAMMPGDAQYRNPDGTTFTLGGGKN